jgi:hypothetical protein
MTKGALSRGHCHGESEPSVKLEFVMLHAGTLVRFVIHSQWNFGLRLLPLSVRANLSFSYPLFLLQFKMKPGLVGKAVTVGIRRRRLGRFPRST